MDFYFWCNLYIGTQENHPEKTSATSGIKNRLGKVLPCEQTPLDTIATHNSSLDWEKNQVEIFLGVFHWRLLPSCDAEGMVILAILALLLEEVPEWSECLGARNYPKTYFQSPEFPQRYFPSFSSSGKASEWSESLGNERWEGWSYPKTNFPIRQVCPWLITFVPYRRC